MRDISHTGLHRFRGMWNAGHLTIGDSHLWVDGTGALRIKATAPSGDTDGARFALDLPVSWSALAAVEPGLTDGASAPVVTAAACVGGAYVTYGDATAARATSWPGRPLLAGTYRLRAFVRRATTSGTLAVLVDGSPVGSAIDLWSATPVLDHLVSISGIAVTAGTHTIGLATTVSPTGGGHGLQVQAVGLERTGA
jgi:hypothetical protein